MKEFTGRVWKLRDNIDTDIIIPTQHMTYPTMDEIKSHAFEPLRPELPSLIKEGDIIVAGNNFGCGSSREQAPEVIKNLGISCIIAPSFARIFFRNAINNGLLLIENSEVIDLVNEGDEITIRLNDCIVFKGKEYKIPVLPENVTRILEDGGLVKSWKMRNEALEKEVK